MIKFEGVTKKYGRNKVLDDISFKIDGGEFVSIVGPSGAGKTTLIHALTAAEPIDQGRIIVDSFAVSKLNTSQIQEYRRMIGIVFQDYKLLPRKTVFENIAFALEVCGYPKQFIQDRTIEALKITALEDQRNHFPHQLSGGEKQRAAIARAIVHDPDLLLADEPTGNLDPDTAMAITELLLRINKNGTTVVLATHNKNIVDQIQQRVISLDKGKLVSDRKNATYK